jgi:hypothetical protein
MLTISNQHTAVCGPPWLSNGSADYPGSRGNSVMRMFVQP